MHINDDGTTREKAFSEHKARLYFIELLKGISYLHENHIVHRDIKPSNLLIDANDELKVADFGVSQYFEGNDDTFSNTAGTPAFSPPEACRKGKIYGRAADVWSCGVVLYCMLFGRLPFMAKKPNDYLSLYDSIINDPLIIPDDVDPDLSDLLHRILDKNPQTRITMRELQEHPWIRRSSLVRHNTFAATRVSVTDREIQSAITEERGFTFLDKFGLRFHLKKPKKKRAILMDEIGVRKSFRGFEM